MVGKQFLNILVFILISSVVGCYPALKKEAERPEQALVPVQFFYPDFKDDMDFSSLIRAIRRNLVYLNKLNPEKIFHYGPHKFTCRQVLKTQEYFLDLLLRAPRIREIENEIKKHFIVYRAAGRAKKRHVLFTGYFEPIFEGSLSPDKTFQYPLYRKPNDLIKIDLSLFNEKLKGSSIVARVEGKRVMPYHSRQRIENEKVLKGKNLEIAWLKDPVDVAFLHIQGSGRIRLPDNSTIPVGYEASNGRQYRSIGRYMIDKGLINRENVSMQTIRKYLSEHPEIVEKVLNHNPSYIFFRRRNNGPFGNINVPLTPGRSIALNARLFPKGALCYITCQKPVLNKNGEITEWIDFSRFVLNQDTGGAIKGAGRADIFWGSDLYAQLAAGHMRHEGDLYMLIKKP